MSLQLEFEPHSWYKGFAIKLDPKASNEDNWKWYAVAANGMTGFLVEFEDSTLRGLTDQVNGYLSSHQISN